MGFGKGEEINHFHSITGEHISSTSSDGIDYKAILQYGREKGSSSLRKDDLSTKRRNAQDFSPLFTQAKRNFL